MKKLFLLLAALSFMLFTAEKCSLERKIVDPEPEVDTLAPTPSAADLIEMVYSNAYDGFLNVREQPDTKAPIIGKILNGPMGAVKMGEVGGWTVVKVGDKIGYASSRYLQTEPTAEFTDKDMEKCIQGIWLSEESKDYMVPQRVIYLCKNGVFALGFPVEGIYQLGEWEVKGSLLAIHITREGIDPWVECDEKEEWVVVNGDLLTDNHDLKYKKQSIMSKKAYKQYVESCPGVSPVMWYKSDSEHFEFVYEEAHLQVKGKK